MRPRAEILRKINVSPFLGYYKKLQYGGWRPIAGKALSNLRWDGICALAVGEICLKPWRIKITSNMTTPPTLQLRSIHDLLKDKFFVPSYQRGYRWTARQVEALLDDLAAFQLASRRTDPSNFYCLQPVVVRCRATNDWELVDGQQRLTTIFLILRALQDVSAMLGRGCYEITYQTRAGSADFLKAPTAEGAKDYIDYHHLYEAYQAIQRWFAARDGGLRLRLLECLTGPDDDAPNVRVIWYELDEHQDPVQAFVRLNVGRIPLTSAELIRAQLLRSEHLEQRDAQQIPQDWDLIERRLQDDGYWYFLQSGSSSLPARIEYLFDVFIRMKRKDGADAIANDPLATFLEFQALLDAKPTDVWPLWQEFKKLTQTLEDWYEDRVLYHLVGFLVATATVDKTVDARPRQAEARVLLDLLKERRTSTGSAFDRHLRQLAWKRFAGPRSDLPSGGFAGPQLVQRITERLDELNYNSAPVRSALLLFNVAGLLAQTASTQRFQFDGYKINTWDIEHVRSVAEYVPRSAADRRRWLIHAREFVDSPVACARDLAESQDLAQQIATLIAASSPEEQAFMSVFGRVRALSGEAEAREDDNALSNLALLDMGTNRSYQNAIFPVKRMRIIDLDKQGQFVPPATRNVFLKYYSPHAAQLMLWDSTDQQAYGNAIDATLQHFFMPLVSRKETA
jgi:hypothetical protein